MEHLYTEDEVIDFVVHYFADGLMKEIYGKDVMRQWVKKHLDIYFKDREEGK